MITLMGVLMLAGALWVAGWLAFLVLSAFGWVLAMGAKIFWWVICAAGFLWLLLMVATFLTPLGAIIVFALLCGVASKNHASAQA